MRKDSLNTNRKLNLMPQLGSMIINLNKQWNNHSVCYLEPVFSHSLAQTQKYVNLRKKTSEKYFQEVDLALRQTGCLCLRRVI